ncbi:hypothetical protein VCHE48_3852 [Vibrio cholerae HE48]|nr:hypothetical protein VCHE48_3852 [Vibrio cholerae HE48]
MGKGGWKKRMQSCNGFDKDSNFVLTRNGADFQLVFNRVKTCKVI